MSIFVAHKPDRQHVQALRQCKRENRKLLELFEVVLEQTKTALTEASDPTHLYRLQGRAKALQDFLSAVDKADEVLE